MMQDEKELCPACQKPLSSGAGIGPYCATKGCPVLDDYKLWNPETKTVGRHRIAAEQAASRPAVNEHELSKLVAEMVGIMEHCTVSSRVCCCGDDMKSHASPMNCGHSPVDSGEYAAREWLERAEVALSRPAPVDQGDVEWVARAIARVDVGKDDLDFGTYPPGTDYQADELPPADFPRWKHWEPQARAALASLPAQGWQSMETAPRDKKIMLSYPETAGRKGVVVIGIFGGMAWPTHFSRAPSHWQPMPDPAPNIVQDSGGEG